MHEKPAGKELVATLGVNPVLHVWQVVALLQTEHCIIVGRQLTPVATQELLDEM